MEELLAAKPSPLKYTKPRFRLCRKLLKHISCQGCLYIWANEDISALLQAYSKAKDENTDDADNDDESITDDGKTIMNTTMKTYSSTPVARVELIKVDNDIFPVKDHQHQ